MGRMIYFVQHSSPGDSCRLLCVISRVMKRCGGRGGTGRDRVAVRSSLGLAADGPGGSMEVALPGGNSEAIRETTEVPDPDITTSLSSSL